MKNMKETMIVNITDYSVYDYLQEGETILELMERTLQYREDRIHHLREACACFPENLHLQASLQEALNSRYQIMSLEEYLDRQREYILSGTPKEITEEEWEHMLSVLPPYKWCTRNGVEMFCLQEMYTGSYTRQFAHYHGKYYEKMVDSADPETWIHHFLAA